MDLKRLKIGRRIYDIRYLPLPKDLYGWVDAEGQHRVIEVSEMNAPMDTAYTLLHEALHGIWDSRKISKRPTEEKAVTEIAWGLTHLFRDNPGLLAYLESLIAGER